VRVLNDLIVNADKNEINVLCLLDLSILLKRLENVFGITDTALKWFRSYLNDRRQTVVIDGVRSEDHILKFGVPQGSVLGPKLFSMYMKPLSLIISRFDLDFHFYADDSQIYKSIMFQDLHILLEKLQQCFRGVKMWMNLNRLKLNDNKTEAILIGRPNILAKVKCKSITLGNSEILFTNVVKNLGVQIDCHLSFDSRVNNIIRGVYMEIRRISKIRCFISKDIAILLMISLVLTKLDYCNSLLANITKDKLKALQVAQNDAARLVFRRKRNTSASDLLKELHWLPVCKRIQYKICTIVHKSIHSDSPGYINELIHLYSPTRNLRSQKDSHILARPKTHRKVGEQSFTFSAPQFWNSQFWNSLPGHVRSIHSMDAFKSFLKSHLFTL